MKIFRSGLVVLALALAGVGVFNCGGSSDSGDGSGGSADSNSGGEAGGGGGSASGGSASDGSAGGGSGGAATGGGGGSTTGGGSGGAATGGKGGGAGAGGGSSAGGAMGGAGGAAVVVGVGCQDPSVILCDDFEKGTPGALVSAPWGPFGRSGAPGPKFTSTRAHSGARAVAAEFETGMKIELPPDKVTDVLWGRVMIWADTVSLSHWSFLNTVANASPKQYQFRLGQQGKYDKQFMSNYSWPNAGEAGPWSSTPKFPLGTWVCIEWFADRMQKISEIYMNGALVPKASGRISEGPAIPVPWNQVEFGQMTYGDASNKAPILFDDVAIGTKRIGCPSR